MICPYCKKEIPDDSVFCEFCEEEMKSQEDVSVIQPEVVANDSHEADETELDSVAVGSDCEDDDAMRVGGVAVDDESGVFNGLIVSNGRLDCSHAIASGRSTPNFLANNDIETEAQRRFQAMQSGEANRLFADGSSGRGDMRQKLTSLENGHGTGEIEVQYAVNRVFLAGGQVTLDIRLRDLSVQVESAHLWLSMEIAGEVQRQDKAFRRKGEFLDAKVTVYIENGSLMGSALAAYQLACRSADGIRFYKFEARHEILSSGTSARVINNTFRIGDNNVLNDSVIKDNPLNGTQEAAFTDSDDLARKMNAQPPLYEVVKERATRWRPEEYLAMGGYLHPQPLDKFTLLVGDFAVYVSAKDEVKFGRHPNMNDFAVLDWKNNKLPSEFPTAGVSREQLSIQNCGDSVRLFTRKDSTLVNDISQGIADNGGIVLKPSCRIAMGPIAFRMNIQNCNMRMDLPICINCMAHKVQSVTLAREDGLPEGFALVWQCCDLGVLNKGLEGFRLYRRNGGFLLKTPSGDVLNLVCGMYCPPIGNTHVRVLEFEQRLIGKLPF